MGYTMIKAGLTPIVIFNFIMLLFFTAWHVFIVFAVAAVILTIATMAPYLNRLMHGAVEELPHDDQGEPGGG